MIYALIQTVEVTTSNEITTNDLIAFGMMCFTIIVIFLIIMWGTK